MSNLQGSINTKINLSGELFKMGTKGYSAYEVAVQQGFKGTVDEWLDSLVGPVGPRGPIGPNNFHVGEEEPEDENVSVWLDTDEPIDNIYVPIATENVIGVVKPGNNLKVDKDGKLDVTIYTNNISTLKQSKLKPQDVVTTLGYYEPNDGGGATYLIREKTENDVEDGGSIHFVGDTLVAEMLKDANNNYNNDDIYLAGFFRDTTQTKCDLYVTNDGVSFERLNNDGEAYLFRDADVIYRNGVFYAVSTRLNITDVNDEISLWKSSDLRNWEEKIIKLNIGNPMNYASDWFVDDDGTIYILSATRVGTKDETHGDYRFYMVECIDLEKMVFGTPKIFDLNGYSVIDPNIVKKDGVYYLFIKQEFTEGEYLEGEIQIWTSTDLNNWTLTVPRIENLVGSKWEAPYVTLIDETYYLYVDDYIWENNGGIQFLTSSDLINWTNPRQIITDRTTRHGFVRKITDTSAIKKISDFKSLYKKDILINSKRLLELNNQINKYIKLATINIYNSYNSYLFEFKLYDSQNGRINHNVSINISKGESDITGKYSLTSLPNTNDVYDLSDKFKIINIDNTTTEIYFFTGETKLNSTLELMLLNAGGYGSEMLVNNNITPLDNLPEYLNEISFLGNYKQIRTNTFTDKALKFTKNYYLNTVAGQTKLKFTIPAKAWNSFTAFVFGRSGNNHLIFLVSAMIGSEGNTTNPTVTSLNNRTYTINYEFSDETLTVILDGLAQNGEYSVQMLNPSLGADVDIYSDS